MIEAGYLVRRLLPSPELSMVGAFVLFDSFGPVQLDPGQGVDIARHGHAHLATVTYFFDGASHHTDSLGNDVVASVFGDSQGRLWIGTMGGGLNRLDRQTGRFVRYVHDSADPNSIASDYVSTIVELSLIHI